MNKIQEVKEKANIIEVAQYFNIILNRNGKGLCPFHTEKTASFSISESKQIWKCFGCGAGGDIISLVQNLLDCNAYEAAKQVNQICRCGVNFNAKTNKYDIEQYKRKLQIKEEFNMWLDSAYYILTNYYKLLRKYIAFNNLDDYRLVEACMNINKIESYIDMLNEANEEEKIMFWKHKRKVVEEVERRLRTRTA